MKKALSETKNYNGIKKKMLLVKNGVLLIEGKRVQIPNPNFEEGNASWRKNRKEINFTSASIQTKGLQEWQFGTFIIRAKSTQRSVRGQLFGLSETQANGHRMAKLTSWSFIE